MASLSLMLPSWHATRGRSNGGPPEVSNLTGSPLARLDGPGLNRYRLPCEASSGPHIKPRRLGFETRSLPGLCTDVRNLWLRLPLLVAIQAPAKALAGRVDLAGRAQGSNLANRSGTRLTVPFTASASGPYPSHAHRNPGAADRVGTGSLRTPAYILHAPRVRKQCLAHHFGSHPADLISGRSVGP